MKTPREYREDSKRCRELLERSIEPEVRIQLRLWAVELEDIADAIECGGEAASRKQFARPLQSPSSQRVQIGSNVARIRRGHAHICFAAL